MDKEEPKPIKPDPEEEKKLLEKDRRFKQVCQRYSRIRARASNR